jgi:inner membrane protein
MQIPIHLMMGWCTANVLPGLNKRQRAFCMIANVIPDMDGLSMLGGQEAYWNWHHKAGHNLTWCIISCAVLAIYSAPFWKSFILYVAQFHLHLVMDVFGSGPHWGIYYFWPFSNWQFDNTKYSWEFYSWENMTIGAVLLLWTIGIIYWKKRSPLEAVMPSLDRQLVQLFVPSTGGARA